MGYYTEHSMTVENVKSLEELAKLCNAMYLGDNPQDSIIGYAFQKPDFDERTHTAYFYCDEACKWYGEHADMTRISTEFPDMVFQVCGKGQDSSDIWQTYYHNGYWEFCPAKIVFEQPTEAIGWHGATGIDAL